MSHCGHGEDEAGARCSASPPGWLLVAGAGACLLLGTVGGAAAGIF